MLTIRMGAPQGSYLNSESGGPSVQFVLMWNCTFKTPLNAVSAGMELRRVR